MLVFRIDSSPGKSAELFLLQDNVLLDEVNTPNGIIIRPILNDLGLSATVDGIEATAVITSSIRDRGQPAYMAPELQFWSSDKPPPRWIYSDIYSFGLLALEVRTLHTIGVSVLGAH